MKKYLNKQERNDYIILCHFVSYVDVVKKWIDYDIIDGDELKRLKTIYTHGKRIVNNIAKRLDDSQYQKMVRDMKDSELIVCTKTRATIKRDEISKEKGKIIIAENDFLGLAEVALIHCKGCNKTDYSKCVVRNCAMELQLPAVDPYVVDECQYKF